MQNFLQNKHFDFIAARKWAYCLSGAVVIFAILGLEPHIFGKLNLGIDFSGGRNYVVRFDQSINTQDVRENLENIFKATLEDDETFSLNVITYGNDANQVRISTNYRIHEDNAEADEAIEALLYEGCKPYLDESITAEQFKKLTPKSKWPIIGYLGVLCSLLIFASYSVVAGWTLEYIFKAATNSFKGENLALIEQDFKTFHNTGWLNVLLQAIFIFLTGFVVFKGVQNGIEKYSKILMPLLLVILVVLAIRSITLPGAKEGLSILFHPDFSKINGNTFIYAMGQGFLLAESRHGCADYLRFVCEQKRQLDQHRLLGDDFRYRRCPSRRHSHFPRCVHVWRQA